MKINKLTLTNWEVHKNLEVNFGKGVIGILGQNGSGKSSILRAIVFALLGELQGSGSKEEYIHVGAKTATVEIELVAAGRQIVIKRTINPNKQVLDLDGEKFTRQDDIREKLEPLIGNTQALINNVFVGQGEIDNVLYTTDLERLKEFQKTFGLQHLDMSHKSIAAVMNLLQIEPGLAQQVQDQELILTNSKAELDAVNLELDTMDKARLELQPYEEKYGKAVLAQNNASVYQTVSAQYNEQLAQVTNHLSQVNKTKDQLAKINSQLAELRTAAELAESTIKKDNDNKSKLDDRNRLNAKIAELAAKLEAIYANKPRVDLDQLKAAVDAAQHQVSNLTTRQPSTKEQELSKIVLYWQHPAEWKAPDECIKLKIEINKLTEDLQIFDTGTCPTCHQSVPGFDKVAYTNEISAKEAKLMELAIQSKTEHTKLVEASNAAYNETSSNLEKLKQSSIAEHKHQQAVANALLAKVKVEYETALSEATVYNQVKSQKEAMVAHLASVGSVESVSEETVASCRKLLDEVKVAESSLSGLKAQLVVYELNLSTSQENLATTKAKLDKITLDQAIPSAEEVASLKVYVDKALELTMLRKPLVDRHVMADAKYKQAVDSLRRSKDLYNKQQVDEAWFNLLERAKRVFHTSGMPSLIMREFTATLNKRMSYYLDIWEAPFKVWLDPDDNLKFMAEFPNGVKHSAARLSGGQKIVASTSFRLAMVDTFAADANLLVLDEPSVYLDKDNVHYLQKLLLKLKELAGNTGRQILLVTHEQQLEGFFDYVVHVKKR